MTNTLQLPIEGMSCASCVNRIEKALLQVPGVSDASVNLASEMATLQGNFDVQAAVSAIATAGYQVSAETRQFGVTGMTCASCAGRVERA